MATASPSLGKAGAVRGRPAPAPEARAAPEIRCAGFKDQIQQVLGWKKGIKQLSATGESRLEHGSSIHLGSPGLEQVSQFVPVRGGGSERSIQFALGRVMRPGRGQMVLVSTSEMEPRVKAVGLNLVSPSNRQQVLDSTTEKASSVLDLGKRLTQGSQSALGKGGGSEQITLSGMNDIAGSEQVNQTASGVGGGFKQITQSALGMSVIQFTLNENGSLEQVIQSTVGENGSLQQGTQSALPEINRLDWVVHSALSKCCGSEQVTQCKLDQRDEADHGSQPVDGCRSESEEQTQLIVSDCKSEKDLHLAQDNSVVPEQPNLQTKAMNLAPDPRTGSVIGLELESEVGVQGKEKSFPPLQHNLSATGLKEWVKLAPFQDLRSGCDKKLEQCLQLPLLGNRTSSQQKLPLESQDMGSSDFTPDVGLEQQIYITLSQSLGPFSGLCVRVQLMHGLGYPLGLGKRDWGAWPKVQRRAKSCPGSLTKRRGSIRSNSSSNRVRFADSVGLELTEVRSFDSAEEPTIPAHVLASFSSNEPTEQVIWIQRFRMEFTNPRDDENFSERLNSQKVCLEAVSGAELVISGTILVVNLAYHKEVTVRFTCNDWKFFTDVSALFESNIEGKMDRFTFTLNPSIHLLQPGCSLQFAIKYKVEGLEFWDNNRGSNYKMTYQSLQVTAPNDNTDRTVDFN